MSGTGLVLQLNKQAHRDFVRQVARGVPLEVAAEAIGYNRASAYRLAATPAVARAIQAEIARLLVTEAAPLAFNQVRKILKDDSTSPRVRADLATKVLQLAGVGQRHAESAIDKPLNEMSSEELRTYVERNRAEIDRLESELAARAKEVSVPDSEPSAGADEAKPLSYLD